MNRQNIRLIQVITIFGCLVPISIQAQVTPDNTLPENSVVTSEGNVIQIDGGSTRGSNLFHSFQDFSVPSGSEALFNNADTIDNILSRVTGGNISNIDGLISTNGTANLFLINPAGIIFGENASLNVGGSFIGTSADSLLFPDGIEYSVTNLQANPILTINAPIGLGFRDAPEAITNRSLATDDTGENSIGLGISEDNTLALIGGEVLIEGGLITAPGGRIELGSVANNSTVSLTSIEQGFDVEYEEVANFQDISLSSAASVTTSGTSTADIQVQGKNISLVEGSQIAINPSFEGAAGDINIDATESLTLDANSFVFAQVSGNAIGEINGINIDTSQLSITNGARIAGINDSGSIRGIDINIKASEIILENPSLTDDFPFPGILSQVFELGTGDGGNIAINTEKLTLNDGAQINTSTFGPGNAGNLIVNASESIELNGTVSDVENNQPSGLIARVERPLFPIPTAGNGGDITLTTQNLVVTDGAQISTASQNDGNGGNLTLNVSDLVLLTGTTSSAVFEGGQGRSGIFVSAEPSYEEFATDFETGEQSLTGEIIPTVGNGGNLTLNAGDLIIEQGAVISAGTFSLADAGNADIHVSRLILRNGGQIESSSLISPPFSGFEPLDTARGSGGTLNINATESVEITGTGELNAEPFNSNLSTSADSNGDAGDITLTTNNLTVSDGGEINTSASALGAAGDLTITADTLDLNRGELNAETAAGTGGNIKLEIDDTINLSNEGLISAAATGTANGGNIDIDTTFIVASPDQNSDIIASAQEGVGGRISIDAEGVFGIQARPQSDRTNDIDASGGVDGEVTINTPDVDVTRGLVETPQNIVVPEQTTAQACRSDRELAAKSGLTIKGKGGIPAEPTAPFIADSILINGQTSTQNQQVQHLDIKPISTGIGDIMPARGVIKTEDGQIILTAYATDNIDTRTPKGSANCNSGL